jgi:hypothetical protein
MALELDGFDAWRAISESPGTFASLKVDASKSARSALTKFFKSKTLGVGELRAARKALGKKIFSLLVEGMKDNEVKTLLVRLDRHHPDLATATPEWRRAHLVRLARGEVEPAAKPATPAKVAARTGKARKPPKAAPEPAPTGAPWFSSAGAVRKR